MKYFHFFSPIALLVIAILWSCSGHADDWTSVDTKREVAFQTVWLLDCLQTHQIVEHPDKWHEENSYLGEHPTMGAVNSA